MVGPLGTWARPADHPSQVALGLSLVLLVAAILPAGCAWLASALDFAGMADLSKRRRFLSVSAFVAAFTSLGYVAFYLHGGPRDALAPAYWVQGRALSHGEFTWASLDPVANFRAAHTLGTPGDRVATVASPGYALLLAGAFLVGAPMLVGPLLAACAVAATWALARELAEEGGAVGERAEAVARAAVGLSVVSAAMRLVTADALPCGAVAVAVTMALAAAMRGRRTGDPSLFALSGLAVGFVVATAPASAVPVGAVVAALAANVRDRRALGGWALAVLPGTLLLLVSNHAALGQVFASPARAYDAMFVGQALGKPQGAVVAFLGRARAHLADVANFEPLCLLVLVPLAGARRSRPALIAGLVLAGQIVVTLVTRSSATEAIPSSILVRSLVAVLPIEHALLALALGQLFPRELPRAAVGAIALSLAGFAVHASHDHRRAGARDPGRPYYEPDAVREAGVSNGLLYFDTDPGFELAFDPDVPASHGLQAVRMRGDDHDRLLYDLLGHPPIHRYTFNEGGPSVVAWTPPNGSSDIWRFEAESDWPAATGVSVQMRVAESGTPCASEGRGLAVTPVGTGADGRAEGTATLILPIPNAIPGGAPPGEHRNWSVAPRAIQGGAGGSATLTLVSAPGGPPLAHWTWEDAVKTPGCLDLPAQTVDIGGGQTRAWLVLRASGGPVTLDKTTVRPK